MNRILTQDPLNEVNVILVVNKGNDLVLDKGCLIGRWFESVVAPAIDFIARSVFNAEDYNILSFKLAFIIATKYDDFIIVQWYDGWVCAGLKYVSRLVNELPLRSWVCNWWSV